MAKLKSKIQPIKQTKTIIGAQSVYAWLIILIGFVLIVAVPYESFGGIIGRAFGIALIIIGLVWGFIVGLPKWWSQ
ncbi:MAG: hypothetical protein K9H65_06950 [Bacteroidales bacterium]|nr:hypothetical protein [Bacteroidales bacterium]